MRNDLRIKRSLSRPQRDLALEARAIPPPPNQLLSPVHREDRGATGAHGGKTVITQDEAGSVQEMTAAVQHHPLASQLLAAGSPELSWRVSPANSLALQCRTDWFNPAGCELSSGRPYVADLKTVESLDADAFRNFERACFNFGYHRQAGFYLPLITEILGSPVFDFFFVAVEKCEPYGTAVYRLSDAATARGHDETITDLIRLQACIKDQQWPNLPNDLREIGLPKWYGGTE